MNIFREIPPTAGFSTSFQDILSLFVSSKDLGALKEDFKDYLKVDYAEVAYSGTAAFYLILMSLKEISSKETVIIPSFVCPLVPLAIQKAGLKVEVCDIASDSFDFNIPELEELCRGNNDILAIVPVHLAGIPIDFDSVRDIVKRYNIFIIEDCAQSLGADYHGEKTGALGDFAFFSLCRGKGLTIYEGGAMVSNKKEYIPLLGNKIKQLVKRAYLPEGIKILELFGYAFFYRPELFWFVFNLPQVFWNLSGKPLKAMSEDYSLDFATHKISNFRQRLGHNTFYRIEEEIIKQRDKALYYIRELEGLKGIRIIREREGTRSNYPYLVLVFDDTKMCKKARQKFSGAGLGVSWVYALSITDYDYLKGIVPPKICSNARYIAENSITLSTNSFLNKKDLCLIVNIIKDL